jgi:hypothetical protein
MKLSQYLHLLNEIDGFDSEDSRRVALREINELLVKLHEHGDVATGRKIRGIEMARDGINRCYGDFDEHMSLLRNYLKSEIQAQAPDYLQQSTNWWLHQSINETTDYRLNRELAIDDHSRELLVGHLLRAADWRWPGLILGPGKQHWIQHLVALDPLYLADVRTDLLLPAMTTFHPVFQRRLRDYVIAEAPGQPALAALPPGQMGWVFAYNFLNYRPLEMINQYLQEVWSLMRPGGGFMFTFNDCDHAHGAALCEAGNFMCYTPGSAIVQRAQEIGWRVEQRHRGLGDVAWLVLRAPGEIESRRGAQCLAKIVAKSK